MKKTSILIAVFAVIAAASTARAETTINFDGNLKPQTLHDVFTESYQNIPDATQPFPMPSYNIHGNPGACAMYCPPFQVNEEGSVIAPDCCGSDPQLPPWLQPICAGKVTGAGWANVVLIPPFSKARIVQAKVRDSPGLTAATQSPPAQKLLRWRQFIQNSRH